MRIILTSVLTGSLLLTGCADGHGTAGRDGGARSTATPGVTPAPSRSESHTVAPRDEPPSDHPRPTKPEGHTLTPRQVAWLTAQPAKDGRSLRIVWWSGVEPCYVLDRVKVTETPKRVTVTLWEGESAKFQNVACIGMAVKKVTTVTLKAPLGEREVVDGARR